MTPESLKLLQYIKNKIGIKEPQMPNYYHCLPICILDDIYSLQSKYDSITFPTVKRFGDYYLNGDIYAKEYDIDSFVNDLERDGLEFVMINVLKNKQCIGHRRKIDVCYDIAKTLQKLGVQSFEDFNNYCDKDYLSFTLRKIKGVGDAAIDYLFMMVGDDNRVKPDIHIHHCILDAIDHDVSNDMCQLLFREVSKEMMKTMPFATPRFLDGLVWAYYSKSTLV